MLLQGLADRIGRINLDTCPPVAIQTAKQAIMDTVGVTLAGSATETVAIVARSVHASLATGPALLFGDSVRTDVLSAALVNGVAAHALDFDDCSNTLGGHPSAPILPALWALAEARGASGESLIAAYIAGFECETRLARAVHFHHYEKGWHPTATLGTFGSAAACGHLIGLDRDRQATALAIAASMAAGIKANFGTMTKPFHIGQTARNGLLAALLAENGMTASVDALEHSQGFLAVYNGAGTFDASRILDGWAAPLDIVEPGVAFKRHPCCGSTHPAVDALLDLRRAHGLEPGNVALIESWTHPRRFKHTNRPDPRTGLDGKFSVQYALACALMHGTLGLDHFTDAAVHDPVARAVMTKIRSAADAGAATDTGEHFYARIRVTTVAGETLEAFVQQPLGRDHDHPLPSGTLEAKARDCARQVLDEESAEAILRAIMRLEEVESIQELSEILAHGALGSSAARSAARSVGSRHELQHV